LAWDSVNDRLYLGANESTNGGIVLNSSGVGITDPSIFTNSSGDLILSAASGTVQVGNGTGDIELALSGEADVFAAEKQSTLSTGLSSTDFSFSRNLTGGANSMAGVVVLIEDVSS